VNKSYKTVENEITEAYVGTQDTAKGRGKRSVGTALLAAALVATAGIGTARASLNVTDSVGPCSSIDEKGFHAEGMADVRLCEDRGTLNPGTNIFTYASDGSGGSNTAQDSFNIGGNIRVWKLASFNGGADMVGTKIVNLANGTAKQDAVNVSQLMGLTAALGGNAAVSADGSIKAPSYVVQDTTADNVGTALSALDKATTDNVTGIANLNTSINNGTIGLVHQDKTTNAITVAAETGGATVDFSGTAGTRQLKGVAAGGVSAASTDAVNGGQLYGVSQSVADAMGGGSTVNEDGSVTKPQYDIGGNTFGNVGDALTDLDGRTTQNTDNIATMSSALNDISSGGGMMYFHSNSTLPDSQATGTDSVAIGGNAQASAVGSVALGANSVADRANTVSVGSAGNERQISNVAAGTADTDAVNVAQLKSSGLIDSNGNTKAVVTYDRNADGSANYDSVTMGDGVPGGTTIHNVAAGTDDADAVNVAQMNAAIGDLATIAANASNPLIAVDSDPAAKAATASGKHATAIGANAAASGANAVAMGAGAVASADNSVALGANSVADRENSVSVGAAGSERQITNVADGTQGTDAVNLNQLNAAATQSSSYTDGRIAGVQSQLNRVSRSAYAGVAAAMAMPNLTPSGPGRTVVAAGGAVYKGESAGSVGVTHRSENNRWTTNGALSVTSTGDTGVRAQVGYEF
jgi:autotransporter adhesin